MKRWALCLVAASAAVAQQPALDDKQAVVDCGSVVIIKCDRPAPAASASAAEARRVELRRQAPLVQELDGVLIEADAIRRRGIEETMSNAFPTLRPRDGNYTFATGEGSQCTCMNVCPPWPLPCCACSGRMNRYVGTPGSSPLN